MNHALVELRIGYSTDGTQRTVGWLQRSGKRWWLYDLAKKPMKLAGKDNFETKDEALKWIVQHKGECHAILDRDKGHDDGTTQAPEAQEATQKPGMGEGRAPSQPALATVSEPATMHHPGNSLPGGNGDWLRGKDHPVKPK